MNVQNTPQFLVNDQTIPVVDSLNTTCMVKSTIINNEEEDDGHHRGVSIHVDEVTRSTTTSLVLEADGRMAVETSEFVKETHHIEVDHQEPKSPEPRANGVEMHVEVEETSKRSEKHAKHPMEPDVEPEGDEAMEIEKKKARLSNSDSEEPSAASDATAKVDDIEQTDHFSSN